LEHVVYRRTLILDLSVITVEVDVMRRLVKWAAAVAVAVVAIGALVAPGRRSRKALRRCGDRLAGGVQHCAGRWQGVSYRLRGRHPDPDVSDDVLADRVRSSIGPLEARLDIPHVHVSVRDATALLHGVVGSETDAEEIERAVAGVSGVVGVESYLHVGLLAGDTRPSEGARHHPASEACKQLVAAAVEAGVEESHAPAAVRAVLSVFAERLPAGEREHVEAHLPPDVRKLLLPPRRHGKTDERLRTVSELVAEVATMAPEDIPPGRLRSVVEAILHVLRGLVPEEALDVAAVLPHDLRELWEAGAR
jgi:uncharacterized protein (DUF2267 family)